MLFHFSGRRLKYLCLLKKERDEGERSSSITTELKAITYSAKRVSIINRYKEQARRSFLRGPVLCFREGAVWLLKDQMIRGTFQIRKR